MRINRCEDNSQYSTEMITEMYPKDAVDVNVNFAPHPDPSLSW